MQRLSNRLKHTKKGSTRGGGENRHRGKRDLDRFKKDYNNGRLK